MILRCKLLASCPKKRCFLQRSFHELPMASAFHPPPHSGVYVTDDFGDSHTVIAASRTVAVSANGAFAASAS